MQNQSITMDNTEERDAELYATYRKFMNELNTTHAEAVRAAVNAPASRYWVSPNYLYREIRRREQGRAGKLNRPLCKSRLYDRLYSDYLSIRERPLYRNMPIYALCDFLVARPAPSFFLSEKRGDEIVKGFRV